MYLFFDTETTGFPNPGIDPRDPKQGRVCQIAMLLTDENGRSLAEISTLVRPDGWTIGEGAQKVHGITDDRCQQYGLDSKAVFLLFSELATSAKLLVAHNIDFDWKMLTIEASAHGGFVMPTQERFCTMQATTELCKLPKARGSGYKWPKLAEALPVLCGREIGEDAHDAMVDTRACRDIFLALRDRQLVQGLA